MITITWGHNVGMTNVNTIVYTETNRDDNVDTGDNVNVNIPEEEEAHNVHQSNTDHHHYHQAHLDVGQQDEGDEEYADDTKSQVSPKFSSWNVKETNTHEESMYETHLTLFGLTKPPQATHIIFEGFKEFQC